jgi:hypothetical protein
MSIENTKKDEKLFSSIYKKKNGFKWWHIERAKVTGLVVGWYASGFYKLFVARYLEDFCSPLLRGFL